MTDFKVRCPSRILSSCGSGVHFDDSRLQLGTNHVQGAIEALFDAGIEGPQGPQGPQGDQGQTGPQGPQGPAVSTALSDNIGKGFYLSESGQSVGTESSPPFAINLAYDNDPEGMYNPGNQAFVVPWTGYWSLSIVGRVDGSSSYFVALVGYDGPDPDTAPALGLIARGSQTGSRSSSTSVDHVFLQQNWSVRPFINSSSGGTTEQMRFSGIYDGTQ